MSRGMLVALTIAVAACNLSKPNPTSPSTVERTVATDEATRGASDRSQYVVERFVDYSVPARAEFALTATEETDSYSLTQGGIHWNAGADVHYQIVGGTIAQNGQVDQAVENLDAFIIPRSFSNGSPTANPCGGVNEIVWEHIDGEGNVLASTGVCRNIKTKEIVGFTITIDDQEDWSTSGESGKFDVQNAITHEMGHVAGLGHDNAPKDGCLTMYRFAAMGETQKRTLGLGDMLGLDALYNTGVSGPVLGCGN